MTEPKREAVHTATEPERPHLLVLHAEALEATSHGEISEQEVQLGLYFAAVVQAAKGLAGLREITLELPEAGAGGKALLQTLGGVAAECGFDLRAVARAEQVFTWTPEAFSACRDVALRVDARRPPRLRLSDKVYAAVGGLHAQSCVVGLQVLLDRRLIAGLSLHRLKMWLDRTDFVTLVPPRLEPPDFERAELVAFFDRLAPVWEKADRFFHLQVDRSIKPAFFPWNLLSVTCPAADVALHLETDGRLFLCTAQKPFDVLTDPSRLATSVDRYLESSDHAADLCEGLRLESR